MQNVDATTNLSVVFAKFNTKSLPALALHICMHMHLLQTQTRTFMHVFMSPAERNTAVALMWQQATGQKTSRMMKVGSLPELFLCLSTCASMSRCTPYEATRVQVNIHAIAMEQLLGQIRSVITGFKIKWEFFISTATCYSTNRGEGQINECGQCTDDTTTAQLLL